MFLQYLADIYMENMIFYCGGGTTRGSFPTEKECENNDLEYRNILRVFPTWAWKPANTPDCKLQIRNCSLRGRA
jgi:hypothetical protein